MLPVLRNIRKNLVVAGSTQKYLAYALGEFLLIVVGILVALQINNWNEYRKVRKIEAKVLTEFRDALNTDLEEVIIPHLEGVDRRGAQIEAILLHLIQQLPYHDSLSAKFGILTVGREFEPNFIVYKGLESRGIDIIKNANIKNAIMELYDRKYPRIEMAAENWMSNIRDYGRPIIRNQFWATMVEGRNSFQPVD